MCAQRRWRVLEKMKRIMEKKEEKRAYLLVDACPFAASGRSARAPNKKFEQPPVSHHSSPAQSSLQTRPDSTNRDPAAGGDEGDGGEGGEVRDSRGRDDGAGAPPQPRPPRRRGRAGAVRQGAGHRPRRPPPGVPPPRPPARRRARSPRSTGKTSSA